MACIIPNLPRLPQNLWSCGLPSGAVVDPEYCYRHQTPGVLEQLQKMLRGCPLSLLWRGAINQLAIVLVKPRIQPFPILISRHPALSATAFSLIESHPQVLPFRQALPFENSPSARLYLGRILSSCGHASVFIGLLCKRAVGPYFPIPLLGLQRLCWMLTDGRVRAKHKGS